MINEKNHSRVYFVVITSNFFSKKKIGMWFFMSKKTEMEWKRQLSKIEYHILREKGTEPPF